MAWTEIRGTRFVNTSGETHVDVQIDFEDSFSDGSPPALPAHGTKHTAADTWDSTGSLIPSNHTCTEPEVVQIRQHHRFTTTKSRITVVFRGFKTGA